MTALLLVLSFLMGAASVAAIIYTFAQRQMDEVGKSFAVSDPLCPYCQGDLEVLDRVTYESRDKVRLKCDCGARVVVYGWRMWTEDAESEHAE